MARRPRPGRYRIGFGSAGVHSEFIRIERHPLPPHLEMASSTLTAATGISSVRPTVAYSRLTFGRDLVLILDEGVQSNDLVGDF
jgi:hypothetical protein